MRGKLRLEQFLRARDRIIPARAGQTQNIPVPLRRSPDHPRACGANMLPPAYRPRLSGSSPRVRGKLLGRVLDDSAYRIIPARAGQTPSRRMMVSAVSDHPRACGANYDCGFESHRRHGSSPRVRGKPRLIGMYGKIHRIIPARAGQTMIAGRHSTPSTDHPRACGANPLRSKKRLPVSGSSPRVRGKLVHGLARPERRRIIPARAGQTIAGAAHSLWQPDHPRACGANCSGSAVTIITDGSSPRVRGKLVAVDQADDRVRIIPARAGQTSTRGVPSTSTSDHPRACGANALWLVLQVVFCGSSPRVRGKLERRQRKAQ